MFDEGFGPEVESIIDPVMKNGGQVVFVTATLSKVGRPFSLSRTAHSAPAVAHGAAPLLQGFLTK